MFKSTSECFPQLDATSSQMKLKCWTHQAVDGPLVPRVRPLAFTVVFSLSARRWWYEVVVIVVVIVASYSSLLPPVTADLLGWFAAIWRYTKSHYSAGHGLEERVGGGACWGLIKEGPHSPRASWGDK